MWRYWVSKCFPLNPVHFCTRAEVTLYSSFYMFSFTGSQLFVSNISPAQGRVALDGPWPPPSRNRQGNSPARLPKPCLPNPACSGEAQVTSHPRLSWWGHRSAEEQLNQRAKIRLLLTVDTKPQTSPEKTKPRRKGSPYTPGGVGCAQPTPRRWRKHFWSHWNVKVRVLMKNTRGHSYATEKLYPALLNYKEFRFFSEL